MHGHNWDVEITVEGLIGADGMVVDFVVLKKIFEPWLEELDHKLLNDVVGLEVPTAENIALWFRNKWSYEQRPVELKSVRVWESPDSYCEVLVGG